jgi:hypothetical protein
MMESGSAADAMVVDQGSIAPRVTQSKRWAIARIAASRPKRQRCSRSGGF